MDYYQHDFKFGVWVTPATRLLLVFTALVFPAQLIFDLLTRGHFTPLFALSWPGVKHLGVWQPLTYMFLHGSIWHLFFNMLGLFFFGPETERVLGSNRFLGLYFACGIIGGVGWLALSRAYGYCIGASGAVLGILAAFAALFPDRPVTLLVFFVIPVTMRARTLAIGLGLFTLLMMISQPGQIAHAAHLAGGIAGWCYTKCIFLRGRTGYRRPWNLRALWDDWRWWQQRRKFKIVRGLDDLEHEPTDYSPTEEEIDRILEKISRFGLSALTDAERRILERASRRRRFF